MSTKENFLDLIDILGQPLTRRQALRCGVMGAAALAMAGRFGLRALAEPSPSAGPVKGKAKSVIQIWLWGGPSHLDTFDPKPEAGNDYCGQFKDPIATNVDGIRICELLPLLAKQADKFSLIRSMTHGDNGHETAAYMVQTGRAKGDRISYPGAGSVVSHFKGYAGGYKGLIPPYVVMTELQGRFSETGFLPEKCKPFATGGDPSQARFNVDGIVAEGITDKRQQDRRELLNKLNTLEHAAPDDPQMQASAQARKQAYEMILGDGAKIFDLSREKDELRQQYGRTKFGQSCLMARRLVENGVPYVTINFNGWDTHKQNFQAMRRLLPDLDKGLSALLQDLADRKLLDSTIIWCGGEFGRTPKIMWDPPWDGGRGHYGKVFTTLVAGGGFKGGHVVGSSDAKGEQVKDRPVYPCDLIGSIYEMLGIDPDSPLPHPQGLKVYATPTAAEDLPSGGRLKEIM